MKDEQDAFIASGRQYGWAFVRDYMEKPGICQGMFRKIWQTKKLFGKFKNRSCPIARQPKHCLRGWLSLFPSCDEHPPKKAVFGQISPIRQRRRTILCQEGQAFSGKSLYHKDYQDWQGMSKQKFEIGNFSP